MASIPFWSPMPRLRFSVSPWAADPYIVSFVSLACPRPIACPISWTAIFWISNGLPEIPAQLLSEETNHLSPLSNTTSAFAITLVALLYQTVALANAPPEPSIAAHQSFILAFDESKVRVKNVPPGWFSLSIVLKAYIIAFFAADLSTPLVTPLTFMW